MSESSLTTAAVNYVRRIISSVVTLKGFIIQRECGHTKEIPDYHNYQFSVCPDCPPVSSHWVSFNSKRGEWICKCGVGHYDPRLQPGMAHCCDGCCGRSDFPGREFNGSKLD